jgi:hypothetical protein
MAKRFKPIEILKRSLSILLVFAMLSPLVSCAWSNDEVPVVPLPDNLYEDMIYENILEEQFLSEEYLVEFFIEEKEIIEDTITETLLEESTIQEIYDVEVSYIPQGSTYSYFDNEVVSNEFGERVDINAVIAKLAVGAGVLVFAASLQCVGVPSTVVMEGVVGSGIGAGIGAGIGGLNGALSEIDRSGRSAASASLALSIAGCVLTAVSFATAVPTGGASLVLAGVFLAAATGGAAYSATECVKTYQTTDGFDIDWNNINWEEVGYSSVANSIEGAADGFMVGAIVGTTHGAATSMDAAKFRNSLPQSLESLTVEQTASLRSKDFTEKQLNDMSYNSDTGNLYIKTTNAAKVGDTIETPEGSVKYVRKIVTIKGVNIEMVVPDFEPYVVFQLALKPGEHTSRSYAQNGNKALADAVAKNPSLKMQFTPEQLADIEIGKTPTGYVWNHSEEEGVLQLVPKEVHDNVPHTGGNYLWGANQE